MKRDGNKGGAAWDCSRAPPGLPRWQHRQGLLCAEGTAMVPELAERSRTEETAVPRDSECLESLLSGCVQSASHWPHNPRSTQLQTEDAGEERYLLGSRGPPLPSGIDNSSGHDSCMGMLKASARIRWHRGWSPRRVGKSTPPAGCSVLPSKGTNIRSTQAPLRGLSSVVGRIVRCWPASPGESLKSK